MALDARKSARLSINRLSARPTVTAPSSPPVLAEVQKEPEPAPLNRLTRKNPALLGLIDALDLELVSTAYLPWVNPEPIPELPPRPTVVTPDTPKLRTLAAKAFKPGNSYNRRSALERLMMQTNVNEERAAKGLAMMEEQGVLSLTLSHEYYLSESTPF